MRSQQSLYGQHCFRSGFGSFASSPRRGRLSPWAKIMRKPPLYRFAVGNAASQCQTQEFLLTGAQPGGAHAATGLGPSFRAESRSVSVSFCGSMSSWRSVQRRVPRDKQAVCFLLRSAGGCPQKKEVPAHHELASLRRPQHHGEMLTVAAQQRRKSQWKTSTRLILAKLFRFKSVWANQ